MDQVNEFDHLPGELVGECLGSLLRENMLSLWVCRIVCKRFRGIISDLRQGTTGAKMREFTVRKRYAAALATGDTRMLRIIQESSKGLADDLTFISAKDATASLEMLKYVHMMGSPITDEVTMSALKNPNHVEAIKIYEWIKNNYAYAVPEYEEWVCTVVMNGGRAKTMEYLVGLGYPVADNAWETATTSEFVNLMRKVHAPYTRDTLTYAGHTGNVQLLQWLVDDGCSRPDDLFVHVVRSGNRDAVKWAVGLGCSNNDAYTWGNAVSTGNVALLQYLLDNGMSAGDVFNPPYTNQLNVLKWAHERSIPFELTRFTDLCPETIEWCDEMCIQFDIRAAIMPAIRHDLALFPKLLEEYTEKYTNEYTNDTIVRNLYSDACYNNRLEHVKMISERLPPPTAYDVGCSLCGSAEIAEWMIAASDIHLHVSDMLDHLIANENIIVLKILHSRGLVDLPMLETIRSRICECGCEIMQWVVSVGMQFDERDFVDVVYSCPLESMIYMHGQASINRDKLHFGHNAETGPESLCRLAVHNRNLDELRWAHSQGYPLGDMLFKVVFTNYDYGIAKWLFFNGCSTGPWSITPLENNRFTAVNCNDNVSISGEW